MLRLFVVALAAFATLGFAAALARSVEEPFFVQVVGATLAFVGIPALVLRLWRPTDPVEIARRSRRLVEDSFTINKAWQIDDELEDEGLHFVLGLSDGRTLFLSGQLLYEHFRARRFPSTNFTLSRDRHTGEVLGLKCSGQWVDPGRPLPAFALGELEGVQFPGEFKLYHEPPQTVLSILGRGV